jgi:hypothetical protein
MVRVVPATTFASVERPFAAATALVRSPCAMAIPQSVSPGETVWTAPSAGVAGSRAVAARAAPAIRAVRSMRMT